MIERQHGNRTIHAHLAKLFRAFDTYFHCIRFNCTHRNPLHLNTNTLRHPSAVRMLDVAVFELWENRMSLFYFSLKSKDSHIPDDSGKELASLTDAYDHARKLIEKIWLYTGCEDTEEWSVIISNERFEVSLIVPFSFSYLFSERRKGDVEEDGHQFEMDPMGRTTGPIC